MTTDRSVVRDLLLLTALCCLAYGAGLTARGLSNWHEAERAIVAREMQTRGGWIVPTIQGRPYLSKPPLIYWSQLAIASLRRARTSEFDLRLTVALAGWLGVLATYLVARRMIGPSSGWWSSLFLATGILYVHSARVGEIDILLVPFTVIGVGGLYAAWRTYRDEHRTNIGAVVIATLAGCGAMLAKGPPGLMVIALAGYGAMTLSEAWRDPGDRTVWLNSFVLTIVIVAVAAWRNREWNADAVLGLILLSAMLPLPAATLIRLSAPKRALALLRTYVGTQLPIVLGLPMLAFYGWDRLVQARVGAQVATMAIERETAENLRLLVAHSPFDNVLAATYGVGIGSITSIFAIGWLVRNGKVTPEIWVLLAWVGGGIIAFSVFDKAVPRYLTPVWPGMAMLGGLWFASQLLISRLHKRLVAVAGTSVVLLAVGAWWWYAFPHPERRSQPSPRSFVQEILSLPQPDRSRLATYEFTTPLLDYYVGTAVPSFGAGSRAGVAELRAKLLANDRPMILLARESQPPWPNIDPRPAAERLRSAGFAVDPISLHSRFTIDKWNIPVVALRVSLPRRAGERANEN